MDTFNLTFFLGCLWLASTLLLFIWQGLRFLRLTKRLPEKLELKSASSISLSLIVCFKDEYENLKICLETWLSQEEVDFELILVNDHSTDQGPQFIREYQSRDSRIRLIETPAKSDKGKKAALSRGINAAHSDYLVFTDADCRAQSPYWLRAIATKLKEADVVLAYGALRGKGFTGLLSEYETAQTALRYWSYALNGNAYMGVGRNMAYRKSVVRPHQSLQKHQDILSGDDDLTLREMSKGLKVACLSAPLSHTVSPAPTSFGAWWNQKARHYSTAWRYEQRIKLSLGIEGILQLGFVLLLPFGIMGLPWYLGIAFFSLRWFMSGFPSVAQKQGLISTKWIWVWPFLEMVWAIATTLLHLRNLLFGAPKKW